MIPLSVQQQIESLHNLVVSGIIDFTEGKNKINMIKENAVKAIHKRAINERSDGRCITKVLLEGDTSPRQVTASSYSALMEKLYDIYFGDSEPTLERLYPKWIEYRQNESSVTAKTIKENGYIWNAHLQGHTITTRPIKALKPIDYISFFRTLTKGRQMTRKRFNDMKSILNGIIYFAIEKGMIDHNPLNDINYRQFSYKAENNNVMPYNENERSMILNHLGNDIYSLAIKLDFHLILRIGELKALKWSDINGNFIYVQRFMNDKNVIVEDIKGHQSEGRRYIPLTESAHRILARLSA